MEILITGGTGLLGRALCKALRARGHRLSVLSRQPDRVKTLCGKDVVPLSGLASLPSTTAFEAIINLAGAPIIDLPWTESRKRTLRASRIGLTESLVDAIRRSPDKPRVLISGSAIGIYGDRGDLPCSDKLPPGDHSDFGARLCADWEAAAQPAAVFGARICQVRTGLVLSPEGGLLARMKPPFRLGLGGPLGSGQQWMSWIHIDDWVSAVCFLLDHPTLAGAFNLVAPAPVRNVEFTDALASVCGRKARLQQPEWLLRAALGQRAYLLLGGQRVIPERLQDAGFVFEHPELGNALTSTCR